MLEVSLNEIMVKVETNIYRKYVIISRNKKPLLYIQIQKYVYGLICNTLLLYRKFMKDFDACGFQINP